MKDCCDYALAESALLGLMSSCLLRPSDELVNATQSGSIMDGLRIVNADVAGTDALDAMRSLRDFVLWSRGHDPHTLWLLLETDYNRLFVGPGKLLAPPYESYYCSKGKDGSGGRLRTRAEFDVAEAYRSNGFVMPEDFIEFPDHIAVELEFCALLATQEAERWRQGDQPGAEELQGTRAHFLAKHPLVWFPECARLVAAGAKHPFYPAISTLTCAALTALAAV